MSEVYVSSAMKDARSVRKISELRKSAGAAHLCISSIYGNDSYVKEIAWDRQRGKQILLSLSLLRL